MSEVKQIKLSELKAQVESGAKLKALAEEYGLPVAQMKKVLKEAGLRIRSLRFPQYQLVDDTQENQEQDLFTEEEEASVPTQEEEYQSMIEQDGVEVEQGSTVNNPSYN